MFLFLIKLDKTKPVNVNKNNLVFLTLFLQYPNRKDINYKL